MVKAILYDYKDDVTHYIVIEPYKDGFHFAFGITHKGKATFRTSWSKEYYRTELQAVLAAHETLKHPKPKPDRLFIYECVQCRAKLRSRELVEPRCVYCGSPMEKIS